MEHSTLLIVALMTCCAVNQVLTTPTNHSASSRNNHNRCYARDCFSVFIKLLLSKISISTAKHIHFGHKSLTTSNSSQKVIDQLDFTTLKPSSTTSWKTIEIVEPTPQIDLEETTRVITTHGHWAEIVDSVEILYQDFIYPPYPTTTPTVFIKRFGIEIPEVKITSDENGGYGGKTAAGITILTAVIALLLVSWTVALCYRRYNKGKGLDKRLDIYYIDLP